MDYATLNETEWALVDEVWDLLEDGELEQARAALDRLQLRRREQPDVRIVEAAVLLEEGEAKEALEALRGAERSADPSLFFQLRALAHYDLCRFDAALADAERALAIQPQLAEAHDLLSRIAEHAGDGDAADRHLAAANTLDPERFPLPLDVRRDAFDAVVHEAVEELPARVKKELEAVPVLVEDLPSRELLTADDPPLSPDLLGLFAGRHLFQRRHDDLPDAPGVIYLFRKNLLRACADEDELRHEIRVTVQHEVGHLLGLDEDDLDRWGLA